MARRVFTVLSALSLLLCVAAAALWVLSYRRVDRLSGAAGGREWSVAAARGKVYCFHCPDPGRRFRPGLDSHPLGSQRSPDGSLAAASASRDRDVLPGTVVALGPRRLGFGVARGTCTPCVVEYMDRSADPPVYSVATMDAKVPPGAVARYRRYSAAVVPAWAVVTLSALAPTAWLAAAL